MPQERRLPAGSAGGRWIVAQRDISEHIGGAPRAHMAIVYDPGSDLILSFGVEPTVDDAVASAFERIQNPTSAGPGALACDPRVISAVRLKSARFDPPPTIAAALNAELRAVNALFEDFLANGPPGRAHAQAITSLEEPARRF